MRELGIADVTRIAAAATGGDLRQSARRLALTSFADIGVFFGVLLVGFAYVWKRGDLDWVRAVTRERARAGPSSAAAAGAWSRANRFCRRETRGASSAARSLSTRH